MPTKGLGKQQSWCFTDICNSGCPSTGWRGAVGFGGLSQFSDWEVLIPEVSAFWPL